MILEPCCFRKQMSEWIDGKTAAEHFITFGDTDLQMLMDFLVHHAPECEVYLVQVQVEPETCRTINKLMEAKVNGTEVPLVKSFVLLHQGQRRKEVNEALEKHRKSGRLLICEHNAAFRCLCVGNQKHHFVLQGSIPQVQNYAMQMFTATKDEENYKHVMGILNYPKKKKQ